MHYRVVPLYTLLKLAAVKASHHSVKHVALERSTCQHEQTALLKQLTHEAARGAKQTLSTGAATIEPDIVTVDSGG
jgi:hypothetical protein